MRFDRPIVFVVVISMIMAIALVTACRDINFWPTDAKAYYFDATVQLPQLKYLSQIHHLMDSDSARVRWLHGKEILILTVSLMQRLSGDFKTLKPFIWVFIIANFFSSLFIYYIARFYWDKKTAWFCFLAFAGSFWPYLYVLFAKHQPLGLVFFLAAVFILQRAKGRSWLFPVSGLAMGLSLFSSTASPLYVPWFVAAFVHQNINNENRSAPHLLKKLTAASLGVLSGVLVVVIYVNWPDVIQNIRAFGDYVSISGSHNHFFYNQPFLQQWFGVEPIVDVRGGWTWLVRYYSLIMPVLFPLYLMMILFLGLRLVSEKTTQKRLEIIAVILLSLFPPWMVEHLRVAQYGGNYFPTFMGILLLLGFAFHDMTDIVRFEERRPGFKRLFWVGAGLLLVAHLTVNAYIFMTDIYPTRLASTLFSNKLKDLRLKKIYTYRTHPHRDFFVPYLSPEIYQHIQFVPIDSLLEARDGVVLLPPVTGDSLYVAATSSYADFDRDDLLNELMMREKILDYAILDQRTIASSAVWLHEEEILSYRTLLLGHALPVKDYRSHLLLLDGAEIWRDIRSLIPREEFQKARTSNIRFIGRDPKLYVFRGHVKVLKEALDIHALTVRMGKQGSPKDSLRVFLYHLDDQQPVWVPASRNFYSQAVSAQSLSEQSEGDVAVFPFDPPLKVKPGLYLFMMYRSGRSERENYYRIFCDTVKIR